MCPLKINDLAIFHCIYFSEHPLAIIELKTFVKVCNRRTEADV